MPVRSHGDEAVSVAAASIDGTERSEPARRAWVSESARRRPWRPAAPLARIVSMRMDPGPCGARGLGLHPDDAGPAREPVKMSDAGPAAHIPRRVPVSARGTPAAAASESRPAMLAIDLPGGQGKADDHAGTRDSIVAFNT